ncbi:MAG: SBBP repeat-containing protein, partial [Acidobacteriota bacterium]
GSELDRPKGVASDAGGNVFAVGLTKSTDFPTVNAYQPAYAGGEGSFDSGDAFVSKFSPSGEVLYSTYVGGSRNEDCLAVALDGSGAAYITGKTGSSDFPSTTSRTFGEVFVTKLSPDGKSVVYSTRYGGGFETGTGIAVDASGNAYVTGHTLSQVFQTTPDSFQPFRSSREGVEALLFKLNAAGSDLVFSTFLGGSLADEMPNSVAVDSAGSIWVVGQVSEMSDFTSEPELPVLRGANFPLADPLQAELVQNGFTRQDCFISRFDPSGKRLLFSTYLGGAGSDTATGVAVAQDGSFAVVVGTTDSEGFPATEGSFSSGRAEQGFVTKIGTAPSSGWMTGPFADQTWDDVPLYDTNKNGRPDPEDQPIYALRNGDSISLVCPAVPNLGSRVTARLSNPHPITGRYQTISGEFRGIVDDFKVSSAAGEPGSAEPATFGSDEFYRTFMGTITGYDRNFRANSFFGETSQIFKDGSISRFAANMDLLDSDQDGVFDSIRVESDGSDMASVLGLPSQASVSLETSLTYFDINQDGHADFASIPWTIIPLLLAGAGVDIETPNMVFVPLGDSDGDQLPDSSLPDLDHNGTPDADIGIFSHTSGPPNPIIDHKLYFAQFGNGEGGGVKITSQILLFNLDREQAANATIEIRDDYGDLLPTVLEGQSTSGRLTREIPAGGLVTLKTDGKGVVKAGSVSVTSDRILGGVVVFGGTIGVAGVGSSSVLEGGFVAPVDIVASEGVSTGVAVSNPMGAQLTLELELLDLNGQVLAKSGVSVPGHGHSAKFVTELSWDRAVDLSNFRGLLRADSGGPVSATVLRTKQGELSTMPVASNLRSVTPNPSLRTDASIENYLQLNREVLFAQFGDGGVGNVRIFSQIMLMNLSLNKTATVLSSIRDDGGNPISIDLNGEIVEGETRTTIPPGGMKVLQTDQQGELSVGSVAVTSDQLIAGVILYGGSVGLAGVGQSPVTPNGFLAPVEARSQENLNTGIAFMNASSEPAEVNLRLLDSNGKQLATSSFGLPGLGHKALFVDQIAWNATVNFDDFIGLIEATGTGVFTGTVVQTKPSILATLPVVPLLD